MNILNSLTYHNLDIFTDWIEITIIHQGIPAALLLLFLEEAGIPMPIPGDVYITFLGYQVSQGKIAYVLAFFLIFIAILFGASILYYIAAKWGSRLVLKLGKYIDVDENKLNSFDTYFKKYGIWAIIIGRHIPRFRVPITIASGIAGIPYRIFIVSTGISIVLWIPLYLSIGEKLGKKVLTLFHTNPLFMLLLGIPVISIASIIMYKNIAHQKQTPKKTANK